MSRPTILKIFTLISFLLVLAVLFVHCGDDGDGRKPNEPEANGMPLGIIEQQQPVIDTSAGGLVIGEASEQKLAQVVTTVISGSLMAVKMSIGRTYGDLVIENQDVTGNEPNGMVLTSETFNGTNFPTEESDGFRSFAFSTPADFSAGSKFAMVLSSPGGSYGIFRGPEGNPYAGEDGFYDARPNTPGVWVPRRFRLETGYDLHTFFQNLRNNEKKRKAQIVSGSKRKITRAFRHSNIKVNGLTTLVGAPDTRITVLYEQVLTPRGNDHSRYLNSI